MLYNKIIVHIICQKYQDILMNQESYNCLNCKIFLLLPPLINRAVMCGQFPTMVLWEIQLRDPPELIVHVVSLEAVTSHLLASSYNLSMEGSLPF